MIKPASVKKRKPAIIITAGPTREKIDPVRFISNYSTGFFGYEIAKQAFARGFRTTLISGPTHLKPPSGVKFIAVESALDMRRAVLNELRRTDYLIMAAAVSDWRPAAFAKNKIKKNGPVFTLKLRTNPDIVAEAVKIKKPAMVVGFSLETESLAHNASEKLKEKGLDIIVANRILPAASPFGDNINDIMIIDRFGNKHLYHRKSKQTMAKIILDKVLRFNI
ncbi:MAG: hypothetical protein NC938_06935 [Candidatus Omnitrophica bacterium]|nr:hypothetical protein [Candidatus Omnitrophota bacterium]MCM8791406.1 hypothetical protein [Candidatus Omnitrophota bacterium]